MSGPPPWTTIGLSPTYLSSTTSRANSSRSAGSSIAAPPYLITTVLPWNSLMYGSASSSVLTSRIGTVSCRVLRVDAHVLVREVGEEHLGLRAAARQLDLELDLVALHRGVERLRVVGHHRSRRAHANALDRHVERERRGFGKRAADRLHDPPPVGVAAVQRRLDERRVRDRARGRLGGVGVAPADDHARDPARALPARHDHDR